MLDYCQKKANEGTRVVTAFSDSCGEGTKQKSQVGYVLGAYLHGNCHWSCRPLISCIRP